MPLDRQDEASQEPLEKEVHQPDEVDKAMG